MDWIVRLSVVFFVSWCVALLLAEVWRQLWNWMDDHAQPIVRNPLMSWVLRLFFRKGGDAFDVWVSVVLITLWPVYLLGLLGVFAARRARGLRRRYKQFRVSRVSV